MMFGYACNETPEYMPLPISLAHKLGLRLSELRHNGTLPWLQPDGKSQVTIAYRNGKPYRIHTIVISNQHSPDISQKDIRDAVIREVCEPIVRKPEDGDIIYHVNPNRPFCGGGPVGTAGDRPHDHRRHVWRMGRPRRRCVQRQGPSKVDRSATYMARYMRRTLWRRPGESCEVQWLTLRVAARVGQCGDVPHRQI